MCIGRPVAAINPTLQADLVLPARGGLWFRGIDCNVSPDAIKYSSTLEY